MRTFRYLIEFRGQRHTEYAHSMGQAIHQAVENRAFGPIIWRYWNSGTKKTFGPLTVTQLPDKSDFHGAQHALFN